MKLYVLELKFTRSVAEAVFDAQKMHKFLTGLVGRRREEANLLYRLDADHLLLFVQSEIPPRLEGSRDVALKATLDIDRRFEFVKNGERMAFYLTVSPYRRARKGDQEKRKRRFIAVFSEQKEWLEERLENCGFQLENVVPKRSWSIRLNHGNEKGGKGTTPVCDFKIVGTVTDKEKFRELWRKGLGREKAYGSGMFLMVDSRSEK